MKRFAMLLAGSIALLGPPSAHAQRENVPPPAATLIVDVHSYIEGSEVPGLGAGIIVGSRDSVLYILTAAHVVQRPALRRIRVRFWSGDSTDAVLFDSVDAALDLAVLTVSANPDQLRRWEPLEWDRLGQARALRTEDPVHAVGCADDRCWATSVPADRVVERSGQQIFFQSALVSPGMSGGALFNDWWEVVGLVQRRVQPTRSRAITINAALKRLDSWRVPVKLARTPVPRAGYRTMIDAVALTPGSGGESVAASGRASITRQISQRLGWHLTALRLGPENLRVTAAMAGMDLHLRAGRLGANLFAEAGLGRVEGRYDVGGYFVAAPGGPEYVPFWNRVVGDGLGVGAGIDLELVVLPPAILALTGGYWNFTTPVNAPRLGDFFLGGGIRFGL